MRRARADCCGCYHADDAFRGRGDIFRYPPSALAVDAHLLGAARGTR